MSATAGPADRTTLIALTANLDIGDTADPALRLAYFQYMTDLSDANYNYALSLVTSGTLSPLPPDFLYRQFGINPNFDRWQAGTSFTTSGYGPDGWYGDLSATTLSRQSTGVPVGSQYCSRMTMTASGYGNYYQAFESDVCKKLDGNNVTFSIKLRRNASFTSDITLIVQKNATADTLLGGTWTTVSSALIASTTLPTGTTSADWYTASVTATIPNDATANGIRIFIQQVSPQAIGAYYEISQSQLCAGSVAYAFQPRSSTDEEIRSLRYRWQSWADGTSSPAVGTLSGYAIATSSIMVNVRYPIPMRDTPTPSLTNNNVANQIRNSATNATVAVTGTSFSGSSNKGFSIIVFSGTPLTIGQWYDFDISADAQL